MGEHREKSSGFLFLGGPLLSSRLGRGWCGALGDSTRLGLSEDLRLLNNGGGLYKEISKGVDLQFFFSFVQRETHGSGSLGLARLARVGLGLSGGLLCNRLLSSGLGSRLGNLLRGGLLGDSGLGGSLL